MAKRKNKKEEKQTISIKVEWIASGLLFLLLLISVLTSGFTKLPFNLESPLANILGESAMDKEEVKERVLKYINEELLGGQVTAEIAEINEDEDSDLYKIKLVIEGQEYDSFISKDGKYLYTERIEVTLPEDTVADYPKQDTPDVLLFTMSYCPYGNQADEFVAPVYSLLKDNINFEPHYVIYDNYASSMGASWNEYCLDEDQKYCSMHGVQELNQDVRELCTFKYQKEKYWDFVLAVNNECDYSNVDSCWEQVAKNLGLDTDKIKSCQADETNSLLANEVQLNEQYGVTGSPAIYINGTDYTGNRTAEDFKNAICAGFNSEPGNCSETLDDTGEASSGSCE